MSEKVIRVLQVTPTLGYGGVEKMLTRHFEHIDRGKVMFDFVTHGDIEPYHEELKKMGSKIFYLPTVGKAGNKGYAEAVSSIDGIGDYDVIHIHVGHLTGLYAGIYRKFSNAKIICHAHTTLCVDKKARLLMSYFRHLARKNADLFLSCGEIAGKYCFGNVKFDIIHNALSFDNIKSISQTDIDNVRSELGIEKDLKIIGHVGYFSEQKNHTFLAEIIHDYVKVDKNVKFILIGNGPLKPQIQETVEKNGDSEYVIFTGIRNDVLTCMRMFDVFVLPSLYEGLPLVGIEAQATATPSVFSKEIDKDVDIGASLCTILDITAGTSQWVDTLLRIPQKSGFDESVYEHLCNKGYEIKASAEKLQNIYFELIK